MSILKQFRQAQNDMENYSSFIEMVPISTLEKYKETDRRYEPRNSPEEIEEIKQSISQNGWTEPLIFTYFKGDSTGLLTEGNHRLMIARELGMTEVPVRVVRYVGVGSERGTRARPVRGHPDAPGYVPADLKPSDIGLI